MSSSTQALVAITIAVLAWSAKAQAQGAPDRGAFVVLNGADTAIVDQFARSGDTLRGSVAMKGAARVDYVIALGPGNTVRTLSIRQFKWGAAPDDAPVAQVLTTMQGDTAIFQMTGNTTRLGTKAGAVPSFGNAFALGELFTRRARAAGGTGDYWYLAVNGGVTVPLTVRSVGKDSMIVTVGGQVERFKVDETGRVLGGFVVGQPAVIKRVGESEASRITFGTVPMKAAEKADYSAPRGAPYTATEVTIKGPAGVLGGTLTVPLNSKPPFAAVVTITGSGLQDRDEYIPFAGGIRLFRELADTLSRRGIAVLRLDDRSIGASGGDAANATSADFADDIRAGIAFLRARSDIDPSRIALAGHSEGGMIGPMIAATDPRIRAVVTLGGPAWKGFDILMDQNRYSIAHAPNFTAAQKDSLVHLASDSLKRITTPWLKYFVAYDPGPTAMKVTQPVLILQGGTDAQIYPSQADSLAKLIRAGGNRDVTVRIFPATNHLFVPDSSGNPAGYSSLRSNRIRPEVLGAAADWLVLKLGPPPVVK